jgi:hypothetical protein
MKLRRANRAPFNSADQPRFTHPNKTRQDIGCLHPGESLSRAASLRTSFVGAALPLPLPLPQPLHPPTRQPAKLLNRYRTADGFAEPEKR